MSDPTTTDEATVLAEAAFLNRETYCPCGHAWDRHHKEAGCMAEVGMWFCPCPAKPREG